MIGKANVPRTVPSFVFCCGAVVGVGVVVTVGVTVTVGDGAGDVVGFTSCFTQSGSPLSHTPIHPGL